MNTQPPQNRRGFTLIEMMITLGVFLLLAGAVFQIFGATLTGAGELQDNQSREDKTEAFGAWLKHQFLALPAAGLVASYHRDGSLLRTTCLVWGPSGDLQALDLHTQPDGRYTLRLAQCPPSDTEADLPAAVRSDAFARQVMADDPALEWRPLLRDLTSGSWRFRSGGAHVWQDTANGDRESVIEFDFKAAGAAVDVTEDCWVPPVQPARLPPGLTSNTVTANP